MGCSTPATTDPIGHAPAPAASLTDLEQLAQRYQAQYPSADPKALLTSVAAHLRMATDALCHDPSPDERRRLRNLAQVAGRLASEEFGNTMSGRIYYRSCSRPSALTAGALVTRRARAVRGVVVPSYAHDSSSCPEN
ncbi:MAG: hypothetical protein ACRDR6_13095 [Pseudonocardiaceae bacterium]